MPVLVLTAATAQVQVGELVLLWLVQFIVFYLLFYGLFSFAEYEMNKWRSKHRRRINVADEANAINGNMFAAMYDLHADSMAARQALIRESFMAAQNRQSNLDEMGDTLNYKDSTDAEVIEPDWYE